MPYVYLCTNKFTQEFYIGYRCSNLKYNRPSHLDLPKYRTSSKIVKQNFDDYHWYIVAEFFDSDDAYDFEQYLIFQFWSDPLLLNESCYHGKPRFKSKPLTEDHKKSISIAQSRPKSNEHRKKLAAANIGNCWYNNGFKSIQSKECPPGFVPGRLIVNNEGFSSDRGQLAGKLNLGKKQKTSTCPHCGKTGGYSLNRHHFGNCKFI